MIMIDVYGKVEVFVDGGFENSIVYVSYICNFIGKKYYILCISILLFMYLCEFYVVEFVY